jgi:hypothetical protein
MRPHCERYANALCERIRVASRPHRISHAVSMLAQRTELQISGSRRWSSLNSGRLTETFQVHGGRA